MWVAPGYHLLLGAISFGRSQDSLHLRLSSLSSREFGHMSRGMLHPPPFITASPTAQPIKIALSHLIHRSPPSLQEPSRAGNTRQNCLPVQQLTRTLDLDGGETRIKAHGHTVLLEKNSHNTTQLRFWPSYNLAPAAFTLGNRFSLKCWRPIAGLKVAFRGGVVVTMCLDQFKECPESWCSPGSGYICEGVSRRD